MDSKKRRRFPAGKIAVYSGLLLFALWSLFPIIWVVRTSLGPDAAPMGADNPFDFNPRFDNYYNVWAHTNFRDALTNTVTISVTATFLSTLLGVTAAYSLARFRFRGNKPLLQWILSIRLAPAIAFVVPFFIIFKTLELLDTPIALIITYTAFLLPFSIWLLASFIREVPMEAEQAALVDGCDHLQVLRRIVLPQIWPAIGVVALLNLVAAWTEFLFALTLTSVDSVTLPVTMSNFFGERGVMWGQITAAAVMTMVVPITLAVAIQRYLLRGISLGS
ncbi:MAG: carbohydrate ABC transporter permease [Chloroflexota bacterium]|nr:carbohydrate ABC transporter permease [Chloroflexota bacterium]